MRLLGYFIIIHYFLALTDRSIAAIFSRIPVAATWLISTLNGLTVIYVKTIRTKA